MYHKDKKLEDIYTLYQQGHNHDEIADFLEITIEDVRKNLKNRLYIATPLQTANKTYNTLLKNGQNITPEQMKLAEWYEKRILNLTKACTNAKKQENTTKKQVAKRNDFSAIKLDDFKEKLKSYLKEYQWELFDTRDKEERFILKSRQIGFTNYFALERFYVALETGKNQFFISQSKEQSFYFRNHINQFLLLHYGRTIAGERIKIETKKGICEIAFLPKNITTCQGLTGDFIYDEVFLIDNFKNLRDAIGAGTTLNGYTQTMLGAMPTSSADAWQIWKPSKLEQLFPKNTKDEYKGFTLEDNIYRKRIDINYATQKGCDFITISKLKKKYDRTTFSWMYECNPISSKQSIFNQKDIINCNFNPIKDSDFELNSYPTYNKKVIIAIDPAYLGDLSAIVVVSHPTLEDNRYKLIETKTLRKKTWEEQSLIIKRIIESYNTESVILDATSIGTALKELIEKYYPTLISFTATSESNSSLLETTKQVIRQKRLVWSKEFPDITAGFLGMKYKINTLGKISYTLVRNKSLGHSDLTSALMLAISQDNNLSLNEEENSWDIF